MVSISNFSPGAFFWAHSFIAATATPPYGPGSPQTRTVPLLLDWASALPASGPRMVLVAVPARKSRRLIVMASSRSGPYFGLGAARPDSLGIALCANVGRDLVGEHPFRVAHPADDRRKALAPLLREALVGDGLQKLPDPEPAGVAGRPSGR